MVWDGFREGEGEEGRMALFRRVKGMCLLMFVGWEMMMRD